MRFLYKIGFYCSFDKINQKWDTDEIENDIFIKFKNYLNGEGILPEAFFKNFILLDTNFEEYVRINERLYLNIPTYNKFLLRIKKQNKNISENELKNYWEKMNELLKYLSEQNSNTWILTYKFE